MMKKTAVVTGASGALGRAVVEAFLKAGYFVEGVVHKLPETKKDKDSCNLTALDLLDTRAATKFVEQVIHNHQSIDVAVFTAGGFAGGSLKDTGTKELEQQFRLNFETAYHIARPVFLHMKQQKKGTLFFIGSKPGLDITLGTSALAYGLSKSLLFRLAEELNAEAKGTGVRAAVIVPNIIDTPANRKDMPDADFSKWASPKTIADIMLFYCSDQGSLIKDPVIRLF